MLRARLLDGVPSRTWVDKIPGIMLALNAMAHEPHGFSASMIATGREPTLLPDLEGDACASPSLDDPASYVEAVKKRLTLTHQQMTPPPAPVATNPYHEGSLIFAMTTPPERTNKLASRWKDPFVVRRIPNPYQVTYEDGSAWRTIHVNHTKPAKLPATGFPAPMPTPELPRPGQQLRRLGSKEYPYSFSSVHLEDLRSGDMEYLVTVQQLVDAIPKTMDPASRFALRGQVTPTGHQHLRHSMRAASWWLLPSDGNLRRATNGIHYYLARQGWRVVLRVGDVTHPLYENRMHWIPDPTPPPPRRTGMDYSNTPVQSSDTPVQTCDNCMNPRDTQVKSCSAHAKSRTSPVLTSDTQASAIATSASPGAPLALPLPRKSRRRRRRRTRRSANENSMPRSATPLTPDERWANHNSVSQRATQHQPEASDPTQMKSAPVYKGQIIHSSHPTQPPIPPTNRNSAFPFGLERCEFPGLYKPALPDLRQDLTGEPYRVNNSGFSLSSPSLLQPCTKPFSGRPARPQMTCPT